MKPSETSRAVGFGLGRLIRSKLEEGQQRERAGDYEPERPAEARPDSYVIHKHAAWLCVAATFAAGAMVGFLLAVIVLVLG